MRVRDDNNYYDGDDICFGVGVGVLLCHCLPTGSADSSGPWLGCLAEVHNIFFVFYCCYCCRRRLLLLSLARPLSSGA